MGRMDGLCNKIYTILGSSLKTYLESMRCNKSKRFKCNSLKWNKFKKATGGKYEKRLPLSVR